jgi:Family of unknown function (DUF5723)
VKKFLLSFLLSIQFFGCFSQAEYTLGFMRGVYQSTYINPASVPNYKVSIGLPIISSVQASILNTGFVFNDVYTGKKGDSALFNISNLISKMKAQDLFQVGFSTDLVHVHVKVKNSFLSFNITDKVDCRVNLTRDLITLAWSGNTPLIGQNADLANIGIDMTHWREYAIGFVKEETKYDFGIRFKFLQGLSNMQTINQGTSLGTSSDYYDLSSNANVKVNTAGVQSDSSGNFKPPTTLSSLKNYMFNFQNPGGAIDIGYTRKITSKFRVSLAIDNIGLISWNSNVSNYSFQGNYSFAGENAIQKLISQDPSAFSSTSYADSAKNAYKYKYSNNSYITWLVPKLYLTGTYDLFKGVNSLRAHGTFYMDYYKVIWAGYAVGLSYELGKIVGLTLTYSARYNRYDNVGVGISIRAIPGILIYAATDNILGAFSPYSANFFNIRTGVNLVFGNNKTPDRQPY